MNDRLPPADLDAALRAVIADPGHASYPEVAATLIAAGRFAEAIQVAEQGLAVAPRPEGQIALADANLQMGRCDHARGLVERLLAASPSNTAAMRILGECHLRTGRPDLAGPLIARAAAAVPPDPRAAELQAAMQPAEASPPELSEPGPSGWSEGPLELDTATPEASAAPPPLESGSDDAPLELDLGDPAPPAPGAPSEPLSRAEAPRSAPAALPPRPPSSPAMPATGARRSTTGSGLQPYAPPHLAQERRRKMTVILVLLLLVGGIGGGYILWKRNLQAKANAALIAAEISAAMDTAGGLAAAEASVQAGLAIDPKNPELLGIGAFIAARRATAFEASTDVLITAQERIGVAEMQERVDVRARVAQALLLVKQKRYGEVIDVISTARSEGGEHPGLLWVRAQAEWKLEKLSLAVESLSRAHASSPDFLPLVPTLAEALVAFDRKNDAIDLLLQVVDQHPDHLPSVILLLDHGATQAGRLPDLLERAGRLSAEVRVSATPTEICRFNLAAARLALAAGDPDRATAFESGASAAEASARCREALGFALLDRERPCLASDVLAGAAEGFATDEADRARHDRVLSARAALRCKRSSRAEALVGAMPPGEARQTLEVRLAIDDGRLAEARTQLAPLLKKAGGSSEAWAAAARLAIAEDDPATARRAALRAAAKPGRDPRHRLDLARLLLDLGEARKAGALLPARRRRRHPSHALLALRGEALLLGGRRDQGLPELGRAIEMNPDADRAVRVYLTRASPARLARLAKQLGGRQAAGLRLAAALRAGDLKGATAIVEAFPRSGDDPLRLSLGRAFLRILQGDASSLKALETLHIAYRARAEAQITYAEALHRLGRLGDAVTAFRAALEIAPGDPEAHLGWAEAQVDGATRPDDALAATLSMQAWVGRLLTTPAQRARTQAALAIARAELNDRAGARKALAKAIALARDEPRVRYAEGRVLEAGGEIRKAVKAYQVASAIPGGESSLLRLGILGADGSAPASIARPALEHFLELQPGHAQARRARQILAALP